MNCVNDRGLMLAGCGVSVINPWERKSFLIFKIQRSVPELLRKQMIVKVEEKVLTFSFCRPERWSGKPPGCDLGVFN